MQINNFMGGGSNQPSGANSSYFPPPANMRPRALAPISSGAKPPVGGSYQTGQVFDRRNSGRYKRKNFDSTDQNAVFNAPTGMGPPRHRRGGSISIPDAKSQGGLSTDRMNKTGGHMSTRGGFISAGSGGYPSGLLPTLGLTKYKNVDLQ